jgi:hypothetical protein
VGGALADLVGEHQVVGVELGLEPGRPGRAAAGADAGAADHHGERRRAEMGVADVLDPGAGPVALLGETRLVVVVGELLEPAAGVLESSSYVQ